MEPNGRPWQIEVEGGALHGLRWGDGDRVAVAVHGITAQSMSWRAVARHLRSDWSLVAVDLRGRGHSRDLPPPYTIDDLVRDVAAVVRSTGAEVLAGHSLGAYVALGVEQAHPGLVPHLVLVDGGLPLPVPAGLDPDAVTDAVVGPMMERLRATFDDLEAYVAFFREHPAMSPYWSDDFDAYARHDALVADDGSVRARAVDEAVRTSGRELVVRGDDVAAAVAGLTVPATLLRAERGMVDDPGPFLPDDVVQAQLASTEQLSVVDVPDTNHYTVLIGDRAARRVAAAISTTGFVPTRFDPPTSLVGDGFRLEPLGPQHNASDHAAWTSSVEHIRATPGYPDGRWPPADGMSLAENEDDLRRHADDFARRTGFTFTVLDDPEVVGCVYLYPPDDPARHDVSVQSWVRADRAELDAPLADAVAAWLASDWPWQRPDRHGR